MYIWKISQTVCEGHETFDSAIVTAGTAEEAKLVHPRGAWPTERWAEDAWATRERAAIDVTAELVGTAPEGTPAGQVILASWNAA